MKQKIIGLLAATALTASLLTGCATWLKNGAYTVPSAKVEKVEQHFKKLPLGFGAVLFGDIENVDEVRSCLILDLASFDGKTEGLLAGISQKGDFLYILNGKSDVELTDYKSNGYGSVDEIIIRYDDDTTKRITNLTGKQLETANKIYELILDQYDKQIITKDRDEVMKSLKTDGEKLEKLIEELKSYK